MQKYAHNAELDQLRLVGLGEALHEGHTVIRVLLDVVLDSRLNLLLLVLNLQTVRQVAVLLEDNLLSLRALQQRLGVSEEELLKEGTIFAHELALVNLANLGLLFIAVVLRRSGLFS